MKKYCFAVILMIIVINVKAQNDYNKITDTLINKSFDELKKIFYYYKNSNEYENAKYVAEFTLEKAIEKENYDAQANSYIRLCRISYDTPTIAMKYIDSCISIAKNHNKEILASGYFYKAFVYKDMKEFNNSLKYFLKASNHFEDIGDKDMVCISQYNIGTLKIRVGASEDAIKIFNNSLDYYKKRFPDKDAHDSFNLDILRSLAIAYILNKEYDSASSINLRGYKLAKLNNDYSEINFTRLEGTNQFEKNNIQAAEDSLLKSIPYLKEINYVSDLSVSYFFLGRVYDKKNNIERALKYYKKVDSIFKDDNYVIEEPRRAYEALINYYKKKEDLKKQLYYTERLLHVDSILNKEYKSLSTTFYKEYDTPRLIADKEILIDKLSTKKNSFKNWIIFLFLALICLLLYLRLNVVRNKKKEARFKEIIKSLQKEKNDENEIVVLNKSPNEKKQELDIDKKIVENILQNLEKFEKEKRYLYPDSELQNFPKQMETNSKYLSKVVNFYKSKSIRSYINDLRVNHAIDRLHNDKVFKNYTIKAMAEEVGFSNTESFTKAFKRHTDITVSFFIKKLND